MVKLLLLLYFILFFSKKSPVALYSPVLTLSQGRHPSPSYIEQLPSTGYKYLSVFPKVRKLWVLLKFWLMKLPCSACYHLRVWLWQDN